jgi:HAMP domain-containing protein
MHFRSLRSKILFGVIGLIVIPCLLLLLFLQSTISQKIELEVKKRGVSFASHLSKDLTAPILTGDILDIQLLVIEAAENEEPFEYIFVLDRDNKPIAHSFKDGFPEGLREANILGAGQKHNIQILSTGRGNIFDIGVPILRAGVGSLHVGLPEAYINESVADIINPLLWMIVGFLIIGCVIAAVFALTITGPIYALTEAADALGSGKFEGKIQIRSKDEIGKLAESFTKMANDLKSAEEEVKAYTRGQEELVRELQKALSKIKTLSGLLPICSWCKRIRDDKGYWKQVEVYVSEHSEADFTHGICPECLKKTSKEFFGEDEDETEKKD